MDDASLADSFRGVNVVVTTPFTEDRDDVRYDGLWENVAFLRDAGVELYIPCGGASESDSLTTAERVRVVEETVDVVGDAGHVVPGSAGVRPPLATSSSGTRRPAPTAPWCSSRSPTPGSTSAASSSTTVTSPRARTSA